MRLTRLIALLPTILISWGGWAQDIDFSITTQSGAEDVGTFTATVVSSTPAVGDITVPFTLGGTATLGLTEDYTIAPPTSVTIPDGLSSASIVVTVNDDALTESSETVVIDLDMPSQGVLTADSIHTITITDNDTPPVVTISAPTDGSSFAAGTNITFTGSAIDAEEGDLSASLDWSSNLDGSFGTGASFGTTALSVGVHTITASVTDGSGLPGSDVITVTITNNPPTVSISAPADGSTFAAGANITFTGTASDPEDGDLTDNIDWSSNLDGSFGTGGSVSTTALSVGVHTITASVVDLNGSPGSDVITVTINSPPTVTISAPTDGSSFAAGTDITFTGTASDPEDGDLTASIDWSSNLDGSFGTGGSFSTTTLSVGVHTITASVTDGGGLPGSDVITVTINSPPTVTISAPTDGSSFTTGTDITFTGTASDPEDGDLTASIDWSSNLDGSFGTGGSFSTTTLSVGVHTITASVTDGGGLPGSDVITVTITINNPPTVTISAPTDGSSFAAGTNITFTGTASDPEDGDLTASIDWSSNLDGSFGSGGSFSTTALSVGVHTITASVVDLNGSPGSDVITVTITNNPPTVTINTPADGSSFAQGSNITFTGTASDPEDGDLTASIAWSSNLDGSFGTGGSVSTSTLSAGVHTITASVVDLNAAPASDVITVTVTNSPPVATSVNITGTTEVGQVLTGNYNYFDAENDPEGTSTFQWYRGATPIASATALTYTLVTADAGQMISFEVTPVASSGASPGVAVQSAAVGPILPANTPPTATGVTITGTIEVGQLLTGNYTYNDADNDPEGATTFRWLRNGNAIAGATAITYTLVAADEGALIRFEVTPVATSGVLTGSPVLSPQVGPILPANTAPTASAVSISGTTQVGQVLTGNYTYSDADNDPEGTSTFRWLRNGNAIVGATAITYTLVAADVGANIIFEVTPVATSGVLVGNPVQSPQVGPVIPANSPPVATGVSITGTLEVGQTLTGNYTYSDPDGDPEGVSLYRWLRNGVTIGGATAQTYTLVAADQGTTISFEVTPVAVSGVLVGAPVESPGVGPIGAANTIPTASNVSISGIPEVGQILTGLYTYFDAEGDLEGASQYRWFRNGLVIAGATFQTYTLAVIDDGALITFEVTPVASSGASPGSPVQSPAVGPILPANTAPTATGVSISGTTEVGQTLTGNYTYNDADGDAEGTSTFRWLRDGLAITGATAITYTLQAADVGANIIFEVTPIAISGVLTGTPVQSASVGPVIPANTAPTATDVAISGVTEVGQTLTGNYTYNDADGDLEGNSTFRWLRNGVAIGGATALTYTLVAADQGTTITFEVTPVAQTGILVGTPVESPGVGPIGAANSFPVATDVTISGNAEVGQTLTGSYTYSDADNDPEGNSTFRWLRNGVAIAGATGTTYTLVANDVGANIIFEVTPVASSGASPGSAVQSPALGPIVPANEPPSAINLSISGNPEVGQTLTGNYTYSDPDGDLEGASTFRWLRDGAAITGATAISYLLQPIDEGSNISFEVLPVALTGDSPGSPAQSAPVGPVIPANSAPVATSVSISGTTEVGFTLTGSYMYSDADGDLEGNTTFRWLRNDVAIGGATALTYMLVAADQGATITFEVTPVAQTGVLVGDPVLSPAVGPVGAANTIPTAQDVIITGNPEVGQQLTGGYTYVDADGDLEGTSTFRWLRDNVAIAGATSLVYTVSVLDLGTSIIFEVTPVAQTGESPGSPVQSAPVGPVVAANSVPIAISVGISGIPEVGQQLNGVYTYEDADGDDEGVSAFRWLRDGNAIDGATSQSYRLENIDLGTNIIFEVTPAAATGLSPGRPVQSASVGPIREPDIEPISITPEILPKLHNAGTGGETFSISINGDLEVERVLFISKGLTASDDDWVTRDLASTTNRYSITVPEDQFDEMGFEYEFVASDVGGNTDNLLGATYIQHPGEGLDFVSLVFGNSVANYNLISFPLQLDSDAISDIFEDDLGTYDQTLWRLFSHNSNGVLEYQSGLNAVERGRGYWLIVRNETPLDTGSGSTVLTSDQEFQLALIPGWNLIGNPYTFNLSWEDVLEANPLVEGVDTQLTTYSAGYENTDRLNTLQGAFVFSEQNVSLTVPLQKDETIQGRMPPLDIEASSQAEEGWLVSLIAKSQHISNRVGGFGMDIEAEPGKDNLDQIRPPRFLEFLDITFEHPEFFMPNFSRDVVPLEASQVWNFAVESNLKESVVTLTWEGVGALGPDKQLWLYDSKIQRAVNMKLLQSYSFNYQAITNFKIVYGSSEFINENLIPDKPSISAAYPNPFIDIMKIEFALPDSYRSDLVDVSVYDLQGRRIKEIWRDQYQPGLFTVIWDGTNSLGKPVSKGVYLLRMNVSGQESTYRRIIKQ